MMRRLLCLLPPALTLTSCGLIKVPFRVTGAVIEGTAQVGRSTYDASKKTFGKSEEEKAEDKKKKQEEAKKKAEEEKQRRDAEARRHADAVRAQQGRLQDPGSGAGSFPLPVEDSLPPLPEPPPDAVPYR